MIKNTNLNRRKFVLDAIGIATSIASTYIGRMEPAFAATKESEIKAAFLVNFFSYINWPNSTATGNSSKTIGIAGDEELYSILERALSKRGPEAQPSIKAIKLTQPADIQMVQLLYMDRSISKQEQWLAKTKGLAILSIGESDGFLNNGGIIRFVTVDDRLRFDINRTLAEVAGFQISTKLLKLARELI